LQRGDGQKFRGHFRGASADVQSGASEFFDADVWNPMQAPTMSNDRVHGAHFVK